MHEASVDLCDNNANLRDANANLCYANANLHDANGHLCYTKANLCNANGHLCYTNTNLCDANGHLRDANACLHIGKLTFQKRFVKKLCKSRALAKVSLLAKEKSLFFSIFQI